MLTERFDPTNMQPSYFCQGDFWGLQIIFGEISEVLQRRPFAGLELVLMRCYWILVAVWELTLLCACVAYILLYR